MCVLNNIYITEIKFIRLQFLFSSLIIFLLQITSVNGQGTISFGTLIDEMTDLDRLTRLPEQSYHTIQFSSYDRRSHTPGTRSWFFNSDGFGGEPIPGFEKTLVPPDASGIGTYLICDINGPGAIMRLWTAGINGRIRLYLDNKEKPVYDGDAEEFFWDTASKISGIESDLTSPDVFRQFDASYFPIPFAKGCRIEWIGNVKKIHFYHVGMRLYNEEVQVKTFETNDISNNSLIIKTLIKNFQDDNKNHSESPDNFDSFNLKIPVNTTSEIINSKGPKAIDYFSVKLIAKDIESALRTNILSIYFDDADIPQVHAPIGDFFGAAPGLNPYISYPFSVHPSGGMVCRFLMPFDKSVRVEIDNMSEENISLTGRIHFKEYTWVEGKSMHFRARWKMDHDLTASNSSIVDIPYYLAHGSGRIVGVAAFIYNPSETVMSWGNWWGEGDEKIFIDDEDFPSFFGTGSEDYFNYSWSAEQFFAFPYCGQPRNDGPGNRGYVSNFRWHISDDLIFNKNISFYMELRHHGKVPHFSYGRIVYAYTLPGCIDDFLPISKLVASRIPYLDWSPQAYLGSSGYSFIQAEEILTKNSNAELINGKLWSKDHILLWKPGGGNDSLQFILNKTEEGKSNLGITISHMPTGGTFMVLLNGETVEFNKMIMINSRDPDRTYLRNYISQPLTFNSGKNEIVLKSIDTEKGQEIGVDFFWLKNK